MCTIRHSTRLVLAAGAASAALAAGAVPAQAAPPGAGVPGCENGCEVVFDLTLPDDVQLTGLWGTGLEGYPVSMLAYYVSGALHDVTAPGELGLDALESGVCGWDGDAQRCAVTGAAGVHSSGVTSVLLTYDGGAQVTDKVLAGTPTSVATDLDGNGRADAVLRQSTYEPSYAEAPQYWETWLEFDGRFARTGCTAPEQERSPAPTAPVYTPCPIG